MKRLSILILVVTSFLITANPAHAIPFEFHKITSNSSLDLSGQFFIDVMDPGADQVLFTLYNTGPILSSIADVYFDDGSLLGIASLINSPGVSFSQDASPSNLPGGNAIIPPFITTAGFLADSDPSVQLNGVNPGEDLGILFDLQVGKTFSDVLADLWSGDLRIGLHVQGIGLDGESDSYINNNTPVPEPATMLLLGSGLLGLAGMRKRFARSGAIHTS